MTEPEENARKIWFPAKRFGWGWGFPCAWQGWVVFVAYFAVLAAGVWLLPPESETGGFLILVGVATAVLIAIAWWKGEPPRWRWG